MFRDRQLLNKASASRFIPYYVLAAIIIVSIVKLINVKEAKFLWKANNLDFWLLTATFFSTLLL